MRRGRRAHFGSRSYGDADREHRAGAIAAITRLDTAALRFDKATADRQTKPGAGALPILGADAIEFIEDAFEVASRDPRSLVYDLGRHGGALPARPHIDAAARRGVFSGVVGAGEEPLREQERV